MTPKEYAGAQKQTKIFLLKEDTCAQGLELCRKQNAVLHESNAKTESLFVEQTFMDALTNALSHEAFVFRPQKNFETIAWCIWHITRIEDATGSILIAEDKQVFNTEWQEKIQTNITDTANAFSVHDIDTFSAKIDMHSLFAYRRAVGQRSQEIIHTVPLTKLKKKPSSAAITRIEREGVLTNENESFWLKDFWAHKTIAGLLLLPMTRHQMMHIPQCLRLKALAQKKTAGKPATL